MRNDFINIVQKCICVDFILNIFVNTTYKDHLDYLTTIKDENLRNIKIITYLYESNHQDTINIEKIHPLKFDTDNNNYYNTLIEYNLNIVGSLEKLRKSSSSSLYQQILNSLITSYFNFISLIHSFSCASLSNQNPYLIKRDNTPYLSILSIEGFNVIETPSVNIDDINYENIRIAAVEAINLFFNTKLDDNLITDEHYEVFFKNNPENKFYQLFFSTNNNSYKIRIWNKNMKIFYLYQTTLDAAKVVPYLTKEDAKLLSDNYLCNKLGDSYNDISYDESYLNIYTYMNSPESYKFKYNVIESGSKVISSKSLYITVDARYIIVSELSLL